MNKNPTGKIAIQASIESRFILKQVCDIITYRLLSFFNCKNASYRKHYPSKYSKNGKSIKEDLRARALLSLLA